MRGPLLYCYDRLADMGQADVVRTSVNRATRRIYIPGICHVTLTVIDIGTHAYEYIRRVSSVAAGCILAELLGQAPLFPGNDSWQSANAHNRAPGALKALDGLTLLTWMHVCAHAVGCLRRGYLGCMARVAVVLML